MSPRAMRPLPSTVSPNFARCSWLSQNGATYTGHLGVSKFPRNTAHEPGGLRTGVPCVLVPERLIFDKRLSCLGTREDAICLRARSAGSDFHESACSTVHESLMPRKCDLSRNAPGKRPLRKTHRERSAGNDIELRQHVYGEPI